MKASEDGGVEQSLSAHRKAQRGWSVLIRPFLSSLLSSVSACRPESCGTYLKSSCPHTGILCIFHTGFPNKVLLEEGVLWLKKKTSS